MKGSKREGKKTFLFLNEENIVLFPMVGIKLINHTKVIFRITS